MLVIAAATLSLDSRKRQEVSRLNSFRIVFMLKFFDVGVDGAAREGEWIGNQDIETYQFYCPLSLSGGWRVICKWFQTKSSFSPS